MKVLRTIAEVREHRRGRDSVGLVPTMGAFHAGHLELMRRSRAACSTTYVSLFVNPTQFGPSEDFAAYPREEARDLALAESVGVDAVFAPSVEVMYGRGGSSVRVGPVGELWEGVHRLGHFDGVATVVAKLFNVFLPEVAFFGLKDLQQCAVVQSLVLGLEFPLRLELVETVRDARGLALSSRNAYFSREQAERASGLFRSLSASANAVRGGSDVDGALALARQELEGEGFDVEYVACVDPATMSPSCDVSLGLRVVCAARFCGVRLIDNVAV